ncbi:UDP-2,3-diacylglucosamine diphosphatase [Constrictibacter sp. MBR-5]|uniref:UDP-2,3-diacylglucosamine diphosphatase n=1 Tax=Constrictibacter sp. MBR-5 TaxID=3156467 RepID=UPI00339A37AC
MRKLRYRTIWISDVHLGTRGCQAAMLLDFLRRTECENLYLVGDIVDGWRLQRRGYWDALHHEVIQALLGKALSGTRVVYIPGNHDELMRGYLDTELGGISIVGEAIHETADGRRLLVVHGDEFDAVVCYARWLAVLGDHAYTLTLMLNTWFNRGRRLFGKPYWSLSAYLKRQVKNAVQVVSRFETEVAAAARRRGVDGVICGHIHTAAIRDFDGLLYCNDGDWVESCTALVEDDRGHLHILHWAEMAQVVDRTVPELVAQAA